MTVSKDFTAVLHFQLEEESFMTDEVVVSANRNEVSRREAPVVVNVMSAKLFETVNSTDLAKSKSQAGSVKVVTVRISSGTTAVTGKAKIKT